jgi:transglutaminase-like putative cysteine protease
MTNKGCLGGLALLILTVSARPAEPEPTTKRLIEECWERVQLRGEPIGFGHTTTHQVAGPPERLVTASSLRLAFRRNRAAVSLGVDLYSVEAPDGKVLGVGMRQLHPGGRQLVLLGAVRGDRLDVTVNKGEPREGEAKGAVLEKQIPWDGSAVGLHGLQHLFEKRKPRPGDKWTLLRYEPTFNTLLKVAVAVGERESVPLPGGRKPLLRVTMTPEPIEVPGHRVEVPATVWWLDEGFRPVRRQVEMEGLGTLLLTRTTEAEARKRAPGGLAVDIGRETLIPLERRLEGVHALRSAVYRITVREGLDPRTAFVQDGHQDVRKVRGHTLELHVHPVSLSGRGREPWPGEEYRAPCYYIDSDDARVKRLARLAAGGETDPVKKALRIERWVKGRMRVDHRADMAPASEVARELRGDCRAYAILTAALCRAEGIPSRTAIGLIQVEKGGRPYLGFHMWTEVYLEGRWVGLDSTLGRGGVGAGHLKVSDDSWHDTRSLTPLLPVRRLFGKIAVEVVRGGAPAFGGDRER